MPSISRCCCWTLLNIIYQVSTLSNGIWLLVQLAFAVICSCLPTYRPLLPKGNILTGLKSQYLELLERSRRHKSSVTDPEVTGRHKSSLQESWSSRYNNIPNPVDDTMVLTSATGGIHNRDERGTEGQKFPLNAISITRSVDMV